MKKIYILPIALAMTFALSLRAHAVPVNVALGKTATASYSWTAATTPNMAVDGDVATRWVTPAFSGWLEVDLASVYSIDSIDVVGITTSHYIYDGWKNYYTLEYRTSTTDPWSVIGSGVTSQYYDPIDTWDIGGVAMRYIRYSVSPGSPGPLHWAHLSELRVFSGTASVPEPGLLILLGSGLAAMLAVAGRGASSETVAI